MTRDATITISILQEQNFWSERISYLCEFKSLASSRAGACGLCIRPYGLKQVLDGLSKESLSDA